MKDRIFVVLAILIWITVAAMLLLYHQPEVKITTECVDGVRYMMGPHGEWMLIIDQYDRPILCGGETI